MQDEARWQERLFLVASRLTMLFPLLLLSTVAADIGLCIIAAAFAAHCWLEKRWDVVARPAVRTLYYLRRGACPLDAGA